MAYCTFEDVERLMQLTFTLTTRPTQAKVTETITDIDARLDGTAQAAGYVVPVTDPSALALMKTYSTYGTACTTWHAGYASDLTPSRVEYWCQEYRDFLQALRDGEVQLPALTPESDLDPAFAIVQHPPRDLYFTGQDEPLE
jgi:hypothetical protein